MRVMTAHFESAGLHFWTISKLVSIEVCGLFIHLLIEVRHLLIIHCNDLVLLAVVILITCHCRHYKSKKCLFSKKSALFRLIFCTFARCFFLPAISA